MTAAAPSVSGGLMLPEFERLVLGALIGNPELQAEMAFEIQPELFATVEGKAIFGGICELLDARAPINAETLTHRLTQTGGLEYVGDGAEGLVAMAYAHAYSGASVVRHYIQTLRDVAAKRICVAATQKAAAAFSGPGDHAEAVRDLQDALAAAKKIAAGAKSTFPEIDDAAALIINLPGLIRGSNLRSASPWLENGFGWQLKVF